MRDRREFLRRELHSSGRDCLSIDVLPVPELEREKLRTAQLQSDWMKARLQALRGPRRGMAGAMKA